MKKAVLVAATIAVALILPSTASAAYYIPQREAELNALDAADTRYGDRWGVTSDDSYCRPQGRPYISIHKRYAGVYHRWTCIWVGEDGEGADVAGAFRITGHSDGHYGYLQVGGGLRWM
jgi:hypothetical protein